MPMSHAPHKPWRVLLVEDDPIIAIMLGDMLHELGCSVIGPAGSAAAALTLIASERIDGAVLDWNLGREDSSLVAEELLRRATPFVFSTGYGREGVAGRFGGIPVLAKPYALDSLNAALMPLLRRA
jgi:DNA-binding response OmpR family regulator